MADNEYHFVTGWRVKGSPEEVSDVWAMARGLESLNLELARLRAATPEERAAIPAPPGPTWPHRGA